MLELKSADSVFSVHSFDEYSYFAGDSLLHTEVPYHPYGFSTASTPFRLRHDGWSALLLFLCLLLTASLVLRLRKSFRELLRGVFFPIPGGTDAPVLNDPLRFSTRLIAVSLLSLAAAVVTFSYTQSWTDYYTFPETPYILFFAFLVLWIAYFVVKRLMINFINWIFFREAKIFTWQRAYTFLYASEAMLLFVFAVVVAYLPVSPSEMLLWVIILVFFFKIVLLFKTRLIFFPKMYGTLHLIVYFCTLELMPLLVMQQILNYSGHFLAANF